ncbi:MAG: Do family serine endopeptidase [Desulfococcaceae bacterium]|nr:Do family serine endopeptidase [Desulfococcaceae bacterium]
MKTRMHFQENTVFFMSLFLLFSFVSGLLFPPALPAAPYKRENAVTEAVKKVSPAVVNISSEYTVKQRSGPFFHSDPFFDSFFRDFFDPVPRQEYKRSSLGSGVIIDGRRGFILTNAHVISQSGRITVLLKDERELEAEVIGADSDSDLAVLRISAKGRLPSVEMGNSDDLMIGEDVIAIGNPFGFSHTVTTGVISALHRSIRAEDTVYHDFIQTDASINPGNSGGPLLNINGELIGINTAIYAKAQGIGFAIPINKARRIVEELIQYGEVSESWIGINVQHMDPRMARYLNLRGQGGVMVRSIDPGSPAEKAGIAEGNVIVAADRQKIHSTADFYALTKGISPGDRMQLSLVREGKTYKISLQAGVFPEKRAADLGYEKLGIKVENPRKDGYRQRNIQGVIIREIRRDSYLARIGARPGDIIRQMDEIPIRNTEDFKKAVVRYRNKNSVVILLVRGGQGYYLTVKM